MTLDNHAGGSFIRDHLEGALSRARFDGTEPIDAVMAVLRVAGLDAAPDGVPVAETDDEHGDCEWPTRSGWRTATCGRSGHAVAHWGIRLCWQHEDAVISEALARIRAGKGHDQALAALVDAVRPGMLRPRHAGAWGDAIDEEIVRRLESGEWLNCRVEAAFAKHIEQSIKERWSA